MRQTLFYLPHQLGPLPLFGWLSWSMLALIAYLAILAIATTMSSRGATRTSRAIHEGILNWILGTGILGFVLPFLESRTGIGTEAETVIGLPIRGYGVMLMIGVVGAVWIGHRRSRLLGVTRDSFIALALYTVVCGLLGARIFYVAQKWNTLAGDTIAEKIWTSLQFTEGGLVVYGSVLGGLVGILAWTIRHRVRPIPLIDAIVPAFFIGLAFGRIGCLLNGCCYGGVCDSDLPVIEFPRGAPAYMDQLESGRLLGLRTSNELNAYPTIDAVDAQSWAAEQGIQPGQQLEYVEASLIAPNPTASPTQPPALEGRLQIDRRGFRLQEDDFPAHSLPVHPAQIYASISAFLLCFWTGSIPNWLKRPGLVFGAGLIAYGALRIMEEIIRVDEAGQFGTELSIAQWISLIGIIAGIALVIPSLRIRNTKPQHSSSLPQASS